MHELDYDETGTILTVTLTPIQAARFQNMKSKLKFRTKKVGTKTSQPFFIMVQNDFCRFVKLVDIWQHKSDTMAY